MLTALIPTRNRPVHCARQLRFLRQNKFSHRIVVLDASEPAASEAIRAACAGVAEFRHFGPEFRMADKLATAVVDVETPFVVLIPDDDVVLPNAIAAAIAYLVDHPDFIVAHGYFVGFRSHENDVDINHMIGFTPSVVDEDPLRRLYNLLRRYQSFYWGVFRTGAFRSAVTTACTMNVVLFRELTAMSTAILQGKAARLPLVYALRGTAKSHAALHQSHPLLFMLRDARDFFRNYSLFRDGIAAFVRRTGIEAPAGVELEQLLDTIYATYLGRSVDVGAINHTARMLLGEPLPPAELDPPAPDWHEPANGDLVDYSVSRNRRYIWRKSVLEAEPRREITISFDDMAGVEQQLDAYD